ncbi:hypothetical protein N7532_004016 [Penicillium argentinense]|uniref:Uncharacterized protein n=1 Tax=Penicillium argentinense TaxID=1131581 RepID=A0A9W9KFR0_9EURO|nr:uncharacterized protein N7532_004016 [Penicillium argentinense]KAJ5103487.1 hypothetical protein N7532_004016 [Penicillium argentinense]
MVPGNDPLSKASIPFRESLFHTARYEERFDLKGKRVDVIGPTWITAGFAQKYAGKDGANLEYSEEGKAGWRRDPGKYRQYRKMIEDGINVRYMAVLRNTAESQKGNEFSYGEMHRKLGGNPRLVDKIIPQNFNVGCRRPTPGNGYLEALVGEKTTVYTENIREITPKGFKDQSGQEYDCDVIICATGFDTSYRPRVPTDPRIVPRHRSREHAQLLYIHGTVHAHGTRCYYTHFDYDEQLLYSKDQKEYTQHIRRMTPKGSVIQDFMEHALVYLPRTCWADPCTSWFKQGRSDGPTVMWPGSRLAFSEAVKSPRWEGFDIQYHSGNRFGFLGSGLYV